MKLLLATRNPGKIKELKQMLAAMPIEIVDLAAAGIDFDVEETGSTFVANATLKAVQYAQAANMPALADDSGIEVDALDGAPGVYSARYGGSAISQPERNALLLERLKDVADGERTARFRCAIVLVDAGGRVLETVEGRCEGRINRRPQGTHGFGYDPVFNVDALGKPMAELTSAEKISVSHRGDALRKMLPLIERHFGAGDDDSAASKPSK